MTVQGIWSGTDSNDAIVRTFAQFEKAEAEWREAMECALGSRAPISENQVRSVAVYTSRLLEALAVWKATEELGYWVRKLGR